VKPARCSTVQKRLLRLEKLWPAAAALAAGFRPQKITSRPLPRISGSYLIKLHPPPLARRVQWLRYAARDRQLSTSFIQKDPWSTGRSTRVARLFDDLGAVATAVARFCCRSFPECVPP